MTEKGGGGDQHIISMADYQQTPNQAHVSISQAHQMPSLAPALQGHGQQMQGSGPPVMQAMQGPGGPQPNQAPQMTMQQTMGQPQFQVIQQPSFGPGGQFATFPQFATYNQQGQLVLQPAFGSPGQQQGQVILSGLPQKPGQPQVLSTGQSQSGGKPGVPNQPNYTLTNAGMHGQPGQQTFIMAPQMGGSGMPAGPVNMPGQAGPQPGQVVHTSMSNKLGENKQGIQGVPPQLGPGQQTAPPQPQFVLPPGMAYMPAGSQQFLQNGQILFRAPGPQDQPLMFSPPGQQGPPSAQGPQIHQSNISPPSNGQIMHSQGQMAIGGPNAPVVRPTSLPSGAPPGKTAISRVIAPLLPTISQSGPRMGYPTNQGQPSPKSKQKTSPRSNNGAGPGRQPLSKAGPSNNQNLKTVPRMALNSSSPLPQQPGSPVNPNSGSPKPPMLLNSCGPGPNSVQLMSSGPPTLTPMMMPSQPVLVPSTAMTSLPINVPTISNIKEPKNLQTATPNNMIPTSAVPPLPQYPTQNVLEQGPPTLTKEIFRPSKPNASSPQLNGFHPPIPSTTAHSQTSHEVPVKSLEVDTSLTSTPKAVVKPQVLTHLIDGQVIKESAQPFPVSPSKNTAIRRKSEKDDKLPVFTSTTSTTVTTNATSQLGLSVPTKRGPGRPPGSTNNKQTDSKAKTGSEPPEKKSKSISDAPEIPMKENLSITNLNIDDKITAAPLTPPVHSTPPSSKPCVPLTSPKNNPVKWNVTQVCDFIKNLPGCADYVEDFALQEIDGQALMLLQADHLMTAMSIKLGPALKICEQVKLLKDDLNKN